MPDNYTPDLALLTDHERIVVAFIADGATLTEAANVFGIQLASMTRKVRAIRTKLDAGSDDRWQAVLAASRAERWPP